VTAWPALLTDQDAGRYLALDIAIFRMVAREHGINPIRVTDSEFRWKKRDLDGLVVKLPQERDYWAASDFGSSVRLNNQTVDAIAKAVRAEIAANANMQSEARLVSISDALHLLGVGRSTVYRLLEDGTLTKKKVGRRTLITRTSIERLLDNQ
jgi:excisionase family DNA binding protein